jgi:hypothetical protein
MRLMVAPTPLSHSLPVTEGSFSTTLPACVHQCEGKNANTNFRVLTHGFTGYRSRPNSFYLDPTLPPQLTNYTIKGMQWQNNSFDIVLTTKNTTITRRSGGSGNVTVEIPKTNAGSGNLSVSHFPSSIEPLLKYCD